MPPKKKGKKEDAEEQKKKEEEEANKAAAAAAAEEEAALQAAEEAAMRKMEDLTARCLPIYIQGESKKSVISKNMAITTVVGVLWKCQLKCCRIGPKHLKIGVKMA